MTRQHRQTTNARPVSNVTDGKHQNFSPINQQERKTVDFPGSSVASQFRKSENVAKERISIASQILEKHRRERMQQMLIASRKVENPNRPKQSSRYNDSSEASSEIDSLYDNECFNRFHSETLTEAEIEETTGAETEFEEATEAEESFQKLQVGLNKLTNNYVSNVQLKVNEALSNLMIQEKPKQPQNKVLKDEGRQGSGDTECHRNDQVYKKMVAVKQDCYKKIEANLKMLKNIDSITEGFHKDQLAEKLAK